MDTNSYMKVINYARSTFSKDEPFHISRLAGDVLIKLIELCQDGNFTVVSNERLGDILYVPPATIKDTITMLRKAGFIDVRNERNYQRNYSYNSRTIILNRKQLTQITQVLPVDKVTSIFNAAMERLKRKEANNLNELL